jgi:hypothetical protein
LWRTSREGDGETLGWPWSTHDMAGFIVMEDGRAYAASNQATDAVIRTIAAEVEDRGFRAWLLQQQSQFVGMGMTSVDLREVAPEHRQGFIGLLDVPTSGRHRRAPSVRPAPWRGWWVAGAVR